MYAHVYSRLFSILKQQDKASRHSPFACTLHASYAKQAMHVPVPFLPEKVNKLHHAMLWSSGASKCITYIEAKCM